MIIESLKCKSFRNYLDEQFIFNPKLNLIVGKNGQGKTSILEAIYLISLTQSFKTLSEKECINFSEKEQFFDIQTIFLNRHAKSQLVRMYFSKKEGKNVFWNQNKILSKKHFVGTFPIILLKPDDLNLSFGSPSERRKFLDILISQFSPHYLEHLLKYRYYLKQKNASLQANEIDDSLIEIWNEKLIISGSEIIKKRAEIINELNSKIQSYYRDISEQNELITIEYQSNIDLKSDINNSFREKLKHVANSEKIQKKSLVGCQRDDLILNFNNKLVSHFASQGENKTYIISLKLAELSILKKYNEESPIILLDDIFSELDKSRIKQLLKHFESMGQVFITTTDESLFDAGYFSLQIENGMLKSSENG